MQKSRVKWLKEGDKNTKFFQFTIDGLKRCNYIGDMVFDEVKCTSPSDVRKGVLQHFKDLFKNVEWQRPRLGALNFKRLSTGENKGVETEFSREEVWRAVYNYDGNRSPSLDGLTLSFIKANWKLIRDDFMRFLSEFYNASSIVKEINKLLLL
ncbi:hypothetical protein Ddye_003156 [Dipteronia dyeriana]|uniref:Uncharacterized protein n=1 Tax=Dipteronia dyeriana TaxID=168575 RepID=A0AAD9XS90_9ROSI|nr:hypothetical protein Ddye_003156 [Dipteronia dyeriana]